MALLVDIIFEYWKYIFNEQKKLGRKNGEWKYMLQKTEEIHSKKPKKDNID